MIWTIKKIIIVSICGVIAVTCIIFTIPFITVPYEVTETYIDTEMTQELYTTTEPYISLEECEKEELIFNDTPYSVPYGISVPITVSKPDSRLAGNFQLPAQGGLYIYSSTGKIVYEKLGDQGTIDIPLAEGNYTAVLRERAEWGVKLYLNLKLVWSEMGEVTRYTEVSSYREKPVAVEKQRTVTRYKKMSLWKIIFSH